MFDNALTYDEALIVELRAELTDMRQTVHTLTAQLGQRDERIEALEAEREKYREALSDAYIILTRERRDFKSKANAAKIRIAAIGTISDPLPFEQVHAPVNPDAPAELEAGKDKRVSPFSCGSQFGDWTTSNCDRCKKGATNNGDKFVCDLEDALVTAYFLDGMITQTQGVRIGLPQNYGELMPYCWKCHEVDWTDEWRAEFEARKAND